DQALKKRLLEQAEKLDGVLRGDTRVLEAYADGVAGMKSKDALGILDRATAKEPLAPVRRALFGGLLRNPQTNAADLAKRAMADGAAPVRVLALEAFAKRKDPAFFDYAVKALADPAWPIRQAAARALGEFGDVRAVAPLVTQIGAEESRLVEDLADVLT